MTASNIKVVQPTMTSLELVDYINAGRKERAIKRDKPFPSKGYAKLRHDTFLKKIEAHPGFSSPEFSGEYTDSTGRTLKCYSLPERESRLMVMAESLEVQTKVLDKLIEMEKTIATRQLTHDARIQLEAHYKEQCLHSVEYELGEALISSVKCADEDNEGILHEALRGVDFTQAAHVRGCTPNDIKAQTLAHVAATTFVGQIARGEHKHPDIVMDVISWARSVVSNRKARANLLAYQKQRETRALTLAQIDAVDRGNKHRRVTKQT